ncbi:glycosyltransferase family 2 protein [Vaginella massiliensis]|uniref:glycosyltransferase family 2 protein n=1 Tax=Vaginella massiliensis TaxID=1816680 RepID=UPI00374FFDE0
MNSSPKISVIVPVYNTAAYLPKCLDSILNQTFSDFELLVVNDGSKDDSHRILEEYTQKDERVLVINKENGGLSDARNFGLDAAKGDYIAFVDSDDYIDLQMLASMLGLAEKHRSDIVFCDLVKVDEDGKEFRDLPQSPQLPEKIVLQEDLTIFGEMSCFACNKLFKRSLFEKHRFRKGIHFEDIELIPKLVLDSMIISKINQPYYKYFERQNSITKTHTQKGLDMFLAIENVTNYFEQSSYQHFRKDLERFQILQGYYSYLGYVAYVKDRKLRSEMIDRLKVFLKSNGLSVQKIKNLQRFDSKYIVSLPLNKRIYYYLSFINLDLLKKI